MHRGWLGARLNASATTQRRSPPTFLLKTTGGSNRGRESTGLIQSITLPRVNGEDIHLFIYCPSTPIRATRLMSSPRNFVSILTSFSNKRFGDEVASYADDVLRTTYQFVRSWYILFRHSYFENLYLCIWYACRFVRHIGTLRKSSHCHNLSCISYTLIRFHYLGDDLLLIRTN